MNIQKKGLDLCASKLTPDSEDQYRFGGGVLIVFYFDYLFKKYYSAATFDTSCLERFFEVCNGPDPACGSGVGSIRHKTVVNGPLFESDSFRRFGLNRKIRENLLRDILKSNMTPPSGVLLKSKLSLSKK